MDAIIAPKRYEPQVLKTFTVKITSNGKDFFHTWHIRINERGYYILQADQDYDFCNSFDEAMQLAHFLVKEDCNIFSTVKVKAEKLLSLLNGHNNAYANGLKKALSAYVDDPNGSSYKLATDMVNLIKELERHNYDWFKDFISYGPEIRYLEGSILENGWKNKE